MAATVAGGIVDADAITPTVVFGGLVGAICWNLAALVGAIGAGIYLLTQ